MSNQSMISDTSEMDSDIVAVEKDRLIFEEASESPVAPVPESPALINDNPVVVLEEFAMVSVLLAVPTLPATSVYPLPTLTVMLLAVRCAFGVSVAVQTAGLLVADNPLRTPPETDISLPSKAAGCSENVKVIVADSLEDMVDLFDEIATLGAVLSTVKTNAGLAAEVFPEESVWRA